MEGMRVRVGTTTKMGRRWEEREFSTLCCLVLRWCKDKETNTLKCDGVEATCHCTDNDNFIDRAVNFYTHGFVFENEAGQVCLPAGA